MQSKEVPSNWNGTAAIRDVNSAEVPGFVGGASGLVLDVGWSAALVTPVFDGQTLLGAAQSAPLGMQAVLKYSLLSSL